MLDGSDCLGPEVRDSDPGAASTELLEFGNIRIELPVPAAADYVLLEASDPHHCKVAPSSAALRMYRRPLPVANVAFLSTILWDGRQEGGASLRENLELQASSAAQIHPGVLEPLAQATRQRIVSSPDPSF